MKTTLNEIFKHNPCGKDSESEGWGLLLKNLGKSKPDDEPLDLMEILESNGIMDVTWALRCFEYRDYCLFLADIVESALPVFEKELPDDERPGRLIQGIRDFHKGEITKEELKDLGRAVYAANYVYTDAANYAYAAAYYATTNAAYISAYIAAYIAADYAATGRRKRKEVEKLFIKHFGGNE